MARRLALLLAVALLLSGGVRAQEPSAADVIADLKARVERLERQNQQLQQSPNPPPAEGDPAGLGAPEGDAAAPTFTPADSKPTWKMDWNNGLRFSRSDGQFAYHVGATTFFDYGWNGASGAVQDGPGGTGQFEDGALIRRARVRMDGTMYGNIDFRVEYDFADTFINDDGPTPDINGQTRFVDVSATLTQIPVLGNIRVGWFLQPLIMSRDASFMERPPLLDSLIARAPGAATFSNNEAETITWACGVFHDTENGLGFGFGDGKTDFAGRVTYLPWYEDDGRELVHLGFGFDRRALVNNQIRLRGRPTVRTMPASALPDLADTGTLNAGNQEIFNVELAGVYGPWSLRSQYYATYLHDVYSTAPVITNGTLFYQGAYAQIQYCLTGESQGYNRRAGNLERIVPNRNFDGCGGWGAWQIGVRYSYLDLQSQGVNGATLNDMVLGLNWYLNPSTILQWNLEFDHRTSTPPGSEGWTYIFGGRLAFDF
jgi:phosphate-selective porin OprO/OprP